MLSESQVKRLLKHCEKINQKEEANISALAGYEYYEYMRNIGWCQALRLVLEKDTYPISKKPLEKE
jgi:hypothetical protein